MYDLLVESIKALQKSKYGKGNKKRLTAIQSALKLAKSLFELKDNSKIEPLPPLISFRSIEQTEQIPKILDEFMNDFEIQCLQKNGATAKNYSLFSVTLLKIIKTLEADKKRGLLSAHAINVINKMFVKHPVEYNKRAIRDPLALVFVITELAMDAERNLSQPYEFDITIPLQLAPFMQKYHMDYDNALLEIIEEFNKMPKFRLTVLINQRYKEIVTKFLQFGICKLSLEDKLSRAKNLLEKITHEKNDSISLEHYNVLKLCFTDKELAPHLAKIAKEISKTDRRFANTILDEVSKL